MNSTFDMATFSASVMDDPLVRDTWIRKYRYRQSDGSSLENTIEDTRRRVVDGVYALDKNLKARQATHDFVQRGLLVPAGRVNAGAGLNRNVTLINCFVSETVQDSLPGIQRMIARAALTMQQGGGIGTDYSTVRPAGAIVKSTGSVSSGVIPFMDQQSAMCSTIESSGSRRGAMMGTLRDDHPDLWNEDQFETTETYNGDMALKSPSFISAKRQRGRLTQFNMSVLVSDAFLAALDADADWDLGFHVPRADGKHVDVYIRPFFYDAYVDDNEMFVSGDQDYSKQSWPPQFRKGEMQPWYVYRRVKARRIWNDIMRSTYVYAEPGIIFIDRINQRNSLYYCEDIRCTNPCFAGDTLIPTSKGTFPIRDLIGKTVTVYDGNEWVEVNNFRVTGRNQQMLKITFQDGATLRVTPYHSMILEDGSRIEARHLNVGSKCMLKDAMSEGEHYEPASYLKGFLLGDGTLKSGARPTLYLYPPKFMCMNRLIESASEIEDKKIQTNARSDLDFVSQQTGQYYRFAMTGLTPLKDNLVDWCATFKERLPVEIFSWSNASKVEFLAGLFDADGMAMDGSNGFGYQLSSIYCDFLSDVQTLLKSIGVRSNLSVMKVAQTKEMPGGIYDCKISYRLSIAQISAITMAAQVKFTRLSSFADRCSKYMTKSRAGVVVDLRDDGIDDEVYCCTVESSHSIALSIGIITGQCGEQPLPPHSVCCLSSVNTAFMVTDPFTPEAKFDFSLFRSVATVGIRFLDNVLDVSRYPLKAQREESMLKRRIGLGVTGWGDALIQLGIPYGSPESVEMSRQVAEHLRDASYLVSAMLAKERGPFPAYDREKYLDGYTVKRLPPYVRDAISEYGIRNGVLNTIAPNGTISLYIGNVSSGHEPVFSFDKVDRKVRQDDGTLRTYQSMDYALRLYEEMYGPMPRNKLPPQFVGAMDISVDAHLAVHAAWQEFIDASISKTINCPVEMSFDDFSHVYRDAYDMGCKGCTTYRPDPMSGRGSVLSVAVDKSAVVSYPDLTTRPEVLPGMQYKLKWPITGKNWYVNITNIDGMPFEMFITASDAASQEWVSALSRTITAVLRRGGDVRFLVDQLAEVHSALGGAFIPVQRQFRPSIVAAIAGVMETEFRRLGMYDEKIIDMRADDARMICPGCGEKMFVKEAGCSRCLSCGFNSCG